MTVAAHAEVPVVWIEVGVQDTLTEAIVRGGLGFVLLPPPQPDQSRSHAREMMTGTTGFAAIMGRAPVMQCSAMNAGAYLETTLH